MRRALGYLKPILGLMLATGRRKIAAGLLLSIGSTLAGITLLGLSGWFITAAALAGLSITTALAFDVFAPSAGIRLLALSRTALRYGERLVTHDATLAMLAALREQLFRGWAGRPSALALMMRPATVLHRLTQDVDALDAVYLRIVAPLIAAISTGLVAGAALGSMHPLLGVGGALLLVLAGLGIPLAATPAAEGLSRRRAYAAETLRARTIDLVRGQTDLVMAGQLGAQCRALARADHRLAAADVALHRIDARMSVGFGLAGAMLLSGTLIAVGALVESGTFGPPVAALGVLIVLGAMEPFAALRRGVLELGKTLLAARRIAPRLTPVSVAPQIRQPHPSVAVELVGAAVRYPGALRPALGTIDLSVRRGERVALIGPSGSGKSTLLSLLAGELEACAGYVACLDATLFTQRTELFQDTLRDNVRLACPSADDARVLGALGTAGLDRYVRLLPDGLDARLGEGGLGLSGGQARRLALARLLLRDTPVWLLDEPTEGLDGATARDVLRRLSAQAGQHTVIVATHVRREAELADRLLTMRDGRIVSTAVRGGAAFDAAVAALRPD